MGVGGAAGWGGLGGGLGWSAFALHPNPPPRPPHPAAPPTPIQNQRKGSKGDALGGGPGGSAPWPCLLTVPHCVNRARPVAPVPVLVEVAEMPADPTASIVLAITLMDPPEAVVNCALLLMLSFPQGA